MTAVGRTSYEVRQYYPTREESLVWPSTVRHGRGGCGVGQ